MDVGKVKLAVEDFMKVFLLVPFEVDHVGKTDILPGLHGPFHIPHDHHRAVEGAHGGAGDGVIFYSRLFQRLPHAHFIGAFSSAALKGNGVGLCIVKLKFHVRLLS